MTKIEAVAGGGLLIDWPSWSIPDTLPPFEARISLDFETVDPYLKTLGPSWAFAGVGKIVGAAIATEHTSTYYPISHTRSNTSVNLREWLADWCSYPEHELIMFNAIYDLGWMEREWGIKPRCVIVDPMAAAALLDETRYSYSLDACAKSYLKAAKMNLAPLEDQLGEKNIWEKLDALHPALISEYAETDARLTYDLWEMMWKKLDRDGLGPIFKLEMDLVRVLLDMRMRGVRVDIDATEREEKRLEQQLESYLAELKRQTGLSVDVWVAGSVEGALLEAGITPPRTEAGALSITAPWLEAQKHDIPKLIVKARRTHKLAQTYMRNYILGHQFKGRIHAQFAPLRSDEGGAVTGRFSSSSPNLQNLSARNPESARIVRGKFLPEDGQLWGSADWSAQEPRLTVHFAALTARAMRGRCRGAEEVVAEYHANPRLDFHQFVADLAQISRKKAKDINLGIAYGMGEVKLCAALGYATVVNPENGREIAGPEGRAFLDAYYARTPFIRDLQKIVTQRAEDLGEIKTLLGRKRRFIRGSERQGKGDRRAYAYKALNALIQGSAADQMKKAMIDCHREGLTIMITLHDELCLSVADEREMARATEIMNNAVKLVVPNVVDVEIGPNWGDTK